MSTCRVCDSKILPFMSFGEMPIANGFLPPDKIDSEEYFFELAPAFCEECGMFQILEQPNPEIMFHDHYAFHSSTSQYMLQHFKAFSQSVISDYLAGKNLPFVVELGSNDGIMLRNFKDAGINHLGIEPSENVANIARGEGINTISEFFDEILADKIVKKYGNADAVLSANVMCHIPNIKSIAKGIRRLLKPDGVLIFEDPYLGDIIEKVSYDQIYDEHVFLFSATSVRRAFGDYGLELIDVLPQVTHGGSMRYVLAPKDSRPISERVLYQIDKEAAQGLHLPKTYLKFRDDCESSRSNLLRTIEGLRAQGKRIVGYGATSKSTTVTNYCGLGPQHIEFISDTTPIKQGTYSPGMHIPVRAHKSFSEDLPEYALLFAWNHAKEIMEKELIFKKNGGKWIIYVPRVEVIV